MTSTSGGTVACQSRACSRPSTMLTLTTMGAHQGICSLHWEAVLYPVTSLQAEV